MIVWFVLTSGDDEGTDETPAPEEETTSMWDGEAGGTLLVAGDPARGIPPRLVVRPAA